MANPINSTKAAQLIESETGRTCTRQNLEKLCERGGLRDSQCILERKPLRIDADLVVGEYLSLVALGQSEARQPSQKREPPTTSSRQARPGDPLANGDRETLQNYNGERARREREVRIMAQMDRRQREGELLERAEVERAWSQSVTIAKTALLGVPSRAKERIPHLTLDEIETLTELIRSALEEVANAAGD